MSDARLYAIDEAATVLGLSRGPFLDALLRIDWLRRVEITGGRHGRSIYYVPCARALNRGDLDFLIGSLKTANGYCHFPRAYVTTQGLARLRTTESLRLEFKQ